MKTNEVKIKGKVYEYSCGLGLMEWLGKELKTDNISEIIEHFMDLDPRNGMKFEHLPKYAMLVRGAVICGSKNDLGNLKEWCYSNSISAMKVFNSFASKLPGTGESDKELVGNLEAAQEAAD